MFGYLKKRVLRIYPAFIIASLICLYLVAPLAGASPYDITSVSLGSFKNLVLLAPPYVPHVFDGTFSPTLNGSMWTISYEFRCYLLVLLLGRTGLLESPAIIGGAAIVLFVIFAIVPADTLTALNERFPETLYWIGNIAHTVRLTAVFLVGILFYLLRDRLRFPSWSFAPAMVALIGCLMVRTLAVPGFALFGGFAIMVAAKWGGKNLLGRINSQDDISYGVYLYAFPIGKLIFWYAPALPLFSVGMLTFIGACVCGWLSWQLVEKPVMRLRSRPLIA